MVGFLAGFLALVLILLAMSIKIAKEYERGVVFRLGRFAGIRGPGLYLIIPIVDSVRTIDLRIVTMDVPPQDVITKDNVPVKVDAVVYFKVTDPMKAVVEVEDYMVATSQISQTSLRSVLGAAELDELLAQREKLNTELQKIIDEATDPWGIKVTGVEIKRVDLPEDLQRAMAKQAEAERSRRARIILAEGEYQAAEKLKEASKLLEIDAATLRYLQTIAEVAREPNTTILLPIEVFKFLKK